MNKYIYYLAISLVFLFSKELLNAQAPVTQTLVYTGAIQDFTVPSCVSTMSLEAYGAQGGSLPGYPGGLGAKMSGVFTVTAGQVLRFLVGGQGPDLTVTTSAATGGGGGSFIALMPGGTLTPIPMLVAGGGGGRRATSGTSVNCSGTVSTNGQPCVATAATAGTGGNGGTSNEPTGQGTGGPGGGFYTNGGPCGSPFGATPGNSFISGGAIAAICSPLNTGASATAGGFGGGGGGCWCYRGTPGGGGGYSGGGTGMNENCSGGGGSYNSGTNQSNASGVRTGNGLIIIKYNYNGAGVMLSSSSNSICSGTTVSLTASNVLTYTWSPGGSNSTSITVNPSSNTSYTLQGTNSLGCISTAIANVTVDPGLPVLTLTNTANSGGICPNATVALTANGATSYTWTGGTTSVTNGIPFSPTTAANYMVTGGNACGTSTAATSVSVHPFPTVNPVASSSTLCAGSGLTLTATGNATNYAWSGGSAPGANGAGFVPPASTTSYSVIGTSALSCTALATIPVTVFPTPINPPTANPALICIGGSSTLSATGALNYTWTSATQTVNTANFVVSPTVGVSTYTITKANSSCINTQVVSVVTNSLPTIFAIVTPTVVCALTPATLAVGGALTYTWTSPGPPSYTFTGASPIVSPVAPSIYSVAASDGTCISTTTVFLNANPNPTITASASTPTTCGGEVITLTASGGINYTWTSTGSATAASQSFTDAPTIPTAYNVTGDNSFGCTSGASEVVLVLPSPTITASSAASLVCNNASVILTAGGAGSYTWSANAGGVNTNTALVNPTNTTSGPVIFTVQGTSANNTCKSTKTVMVNVFIPTLTVGGNTNTCAGGSVTLSILGGTSNYNWNTGTGNFTTPGVVATLTAPAVFTLSANTLSAGVTCSSTNTVQLGIYFNPTITAVAQRTTICKNESVDITAGGGINYQWNTGSTNTVLTVSPVGNIINYTVTGTDANGCSNTATVQIKISTCSGLSTLSSANAGLSIYPNPNNGVFNIEANTTIKLNLVNELGQLVRVITLSDANNYKVSVNDLAKGIYFISGENGDVQIYEKIIITK